MATKRKAGDYSPGKLTLDLLRRIDGWPKPEKPRELRDGPIILRRQPSGAMSLYVQLGRGKRERLCSVADILDPSTDATLTAIRQRAKLLLGEAAGGRDFSAERQQRRGVPTLEQWLSDTEGMYGHWVKGARKTGEATGARIAHAFAKFARRRLDDITVADFEAWRVKRLGEVSAETVNRETVALRASLAKAVEWGILDTHPLGAVKLLKVDRRRRPLRALTDDEVARLVAALEARDQRKADRRDSANEWREARGRELKPSLRGKFADTLTPAVIVSLETGLRRGELAALEWSAVDLKAKLLRVRGEDAKSAQTREIPLNARAVAVLRAWHMQEGRPGAGRIFRDVLTRRKSFPGVLAAAGISGTGDSRVTWHSLRHTFGTRLGVRGVDLETLRELLGHANIATTSRYLHTTQQRKAAAVAALEA